jgi:hypothetical protein
MVSLLIFETFATAAVLFSTASVWYIVYKTRLRLLSTKAPESAPSVPARSGRNLGPRIDMKDQPVFLSVEERRNKIVALASDPEYLEKLDAIRKSRRNFCIPPDVEAQTDHASWRSRQSR